MRFGSLFSGVGGFDLGLERAGHECVWQVEYDKQARAVLRRHWPNVDLYEDVRDVGSTTLAPVDLICGGFPCQDLSVAGRRAGLDGERSGLWFDFARICRELAPRWVLIENVPGLLSSGGGSDFGTVIQGLGELGYVGAWRVVDSQHFGVAQRRKRVFLLACRDPRGASPAEILAIPEGLSGHPAPGREAGAGVANALTGGSGKKGGPDDNAAQGGHVVAGHLNCTCPAGCDCENPEPEQGAALCSNGCPVHNLYPEPDPECPLHGRFGVTAATHDIAPTLQERGGKGPDSDCTQALAFQVAHTLRAEGFDASEDGTGRGTPIVAFGWNKSASQTMRVDGETTDALQASETSNPAVLPFQASKQHGVASFALRGRDGGTTAEMGGDQAHALRSSQGGGNRAHVLTAVPRRLTPTECERLQAFPEVEKNAILEVWNSPESRQNNAPAVTTSHRSPSSAFNVDASASPLSANLAEKSSDTSRRGQDLPVVAHVLIDSGAGEVAVKTAEELFSFASNVVDESSSPLAIASADFALLVAGTLLILERTTRHGRVASPKASGSSSHLPNGSTFAGMSGQEIAALAKDAGRLTAMAKELLKSITSQVGNNSQIYEPTWETWCSCVIAAIAGCIPEPTFSESSFAVSLTVRSGWTAWGVDDEGNRVEMADGPRYRMMGNAVTVNVAHWIGRRLKEAHAKQQDQAG